MKYVYERLNGSQFRFCRFCSFFGGGGIVRSIITTFSNSEGASNCLHRIRILALARNTYAFSSHEYDAIMIFSTLIEGII